MPTKPYHLRSPNAVPFEYSGKWIAWSSDHSTIIASGDTIAEVWQIVNELAVDDPIFQKVPRADVRLVGKQ